MTIAVDLGRKATKTNKMYASSESLGEPPQHTVAHAYLSFGCSLSAVPYTVNVFLKNAISSYVDNLLQ